MSYQQKIADIARLIKQSPKTIALTGAGISTESGIPDYRSPKTGLWEKHDPAKTASLSALRTNPAQFYDDNLSRWTSYHDARPNDAHRALAQLEKLNLLTGVITQNIDSLHVRAGGVNIWEVHGHLRTCRCMECKQLHDFEHLVTRYQQGENPPLCTHCQGVLRPSVVLFEDQMSEDFFQASQVISGCHLMIVVGSSLTVYPVAGLPGVAKQLVIINNTPTPWDQEAMVVVREKAGQVLPDVVDIIQADGARH